MIDPIQILLAFVIVTLTILLFIIGLEIFQLLKELKKTFEKFNKILTDAGRITESIAEPIEEASDFILGLQKGVKFFKIVSKFFKNDGKKKSKKSEDIEEAEEVEEKPEETIKKPEKSEKPEEIDKKKPKKASKSGSVFSEKKRFFTKKGKSLGK